MGRAQMWDGSEWIDMTGGAGEGEPDNPDNIYLRLDSSNNPAAPNNFITTAGANALYLPLGGGTLSGDLTLGTGVDILGSATSLIKGQDWQFSVQPGAFKDVGGANRIIFQAGFIDQASTSFNAGFYISTYDPNPPPYGGGDTFWYQGRNIRFKDTPGPPSDAEGQDGDVCLMYTF